MKASVFLSILFVVITFCNATNARRRIGGTYGCEIVASSHPVRSAWQDLHRRSNYGESCHLEDIRNAIVPVKRGRCIGIMLSDRIGLTATTCVIERNRKRTCDTGGDFQVIRHLQYYRSSHNGLMKHDIAIFNKRNATVNRDLNCVKNSCKVSTMCKIIREDGTTLDVSLAYCSSEYHPGSDIDASRTNPNYCHTMCVKRLNSEAIPQLLRGSPIVCKDESRPREDKWLIRGIISFRKVGHHDYAMASMIDRSVLTDTTCNCPSFYP